MAILAWKGKKAYAVTHLKGGKRQWAALKNPRTGYNHFDTKHEGQMAFLEWIKWNDRKIVEKDILFEDALAKYLALSKAQKAPVTYDREVNHSKALLTQFETLPVSEITSVRLETFKKAHNWAPTTWAIRLGLLKKVIDYCAAHDFKTSEPFKTVKIPRPKIHEMAPRYARMEAIDALIDLLKDDHKTYAMILKYLMLRPNEPLKLKREDVDFARRVVRLRGKDKKWEYLPFPEELAPYLKKLPLKVSQGAFAQAVKRVCKSKTWEHQKIVPYMFRHSSASFLVNERLRGGERAVQSLLRHKDPKLTARYAHPYEETIREAQEKLK